MNVKSLTSSQTKMSGFLAILFPIAVQIPFARLALSFDYPRILRSEPGAVLERFADGGVSLIGTWYAYAASIIVFLGLNFFLSRSVRSPARSGLLILGTVSGIVQMVALLRWVFLVPVLARAYLVAEKDVARETLRILFAAQHTYLGVGLGEHLGQATMAAWTLALTYCLVRSFWGLRTIGFASAALLGLGLSEHLVTALGVNVSHLDLLTTVGFMLWSVWLLAIGVRLLRASLPTQARNGDPGGDGVVSSSRGNPFGS